MTSSRGSYTGVAGRARKAPLVLSKTKAEGPWFIEEEGGVSPFELFAER